MAAVIWTRDVLPVDGRKTFNKRAVVRGYDDGVEVLSSCHSGDVLSRDNEGRLHRHSRDDSGIVLRHVTAYCGMNEKDYRKMPVEPIDYGHSFASMIRYRRETK